MEEKTVHIPNISCGHCVMTIKNELLDIKGVENVEGDAEKNTVTVRWKSPVEWNAINNTLYEIGYPPKE